MLSGETPSNPLSFPPPPPPPPSPSLSSKWPDTFQPWPVLATTLDEDAHMYTAKEVHACRQWLERKEHRDFRKWAGVKVTDTKAWRDLESIIEIVLALEGPRAWSAASKTACKEVWESKGQAAGKHNSLNDNKEVGRRTARIQLEGSEAEWADELLRWAELAFTALAPRLNSLAKKSRQAEGKKDLSDIVPMTSKPSQKSKDLTSPTKAPQGSEDSTSASRTPSPQKRIRISRNRSMPRPVLDAVSSSEDPLPHKMSALSTRPLCDWNIAVRSKEAQDGDATCLVALVAVSSIVEESASGMLAYNILCDHLSWTKLKDLLREINPRYNIDGGKKLSWLCSEMAEGEENVLIDDEISFCNAIATQEWKMREAASYNPLELQISDRYRY